MNSTASILLLWISLYSIGVSVFIHLKRQKIIHKKLLLILVVSLALLSMCINPIPSWDLYRHYIFLEDIRSNGIGFYDFLFDNRMRIGGSDYVTLISFNILRYMVAITGIYSLLPFIMTLITYLIWFYITVDWCKEHRINSLDIMFSLILSLVMMPYIFVNSGLRNTTASAIVGLGIYLYLYRNHSLAKLVVLSIIAFTIHPSIAHILLVFSISYLFKSMKLATFILILLTNVIPILCTFFYNSEFEILRKLAYSFSIYTANRFEDLNFYVISVYLVALFFCFRFFIGDVKFNKNENKISRFLLMMCLNAFFYIGYTEFVLRPSYIIGILSTPFLYFMYVNQPSRSMKITAAVIILIAFIIVERISLPEYLVLRYL